MKRTLVTWIISFFALVAVLSALVASDFFHNRIASPQLSDVVDRIIYQVNPFSNLMSRSGTDGSVVDIKLSQEDIESLSNTYRKSVVEGSNSLIDSLNKWRDAKMLIGSTEYKVKVKIHGTSLTPYKKSIRIVEKISSRLLGMAKNTNITDGGFGFKIKLKRSSPEYYRLMRRVNYLTPYDDWGVSTISINKYAAKIGLISPYGRIVRLRINGIEIGPYMEVEQHSKEFLERNYGITSYSVLKSNDDWDKSVSSHASLTDLYANDKEQSGSEMVDRIALQKLERLFQAVKEADLEQVKELLDYDYMSKYLAWLSIVNNIHSVTGDNLKYIYDLSTGKFKILFRVEDGIKKIRHGDTVAFFGNIFTENDYPNDISADYVYKLFNLIGADDDFVRRRNHHLSLIVRESNNIISIFERDFTEASAVLGVARFPVQRFYRQHKEQVDYLKFNLEHAEKYINYGKVFVTNYYDNDGRGVKSKVLVESAAPFVAKQVIECGKGEKKVLDNFAFDRLEFSLEGINISLKEYNFDHCIKEINLINQETGRSIDGSDVYYNESYYSERPLSIYKGDMVRLGSIYTDESGVLHVPKGVHKFDVDTVIEPTKSSTIIHPGAMIHLGAGISVVIKGSVYAEGTSDFPIYVKNSNDVNFGSFVIKGKGKDKSRVVLKNFHVSGGNQAVVDGVYYSGQISIYDADVEVVSSTFKNSVSDDGINIKRSNINVAESKFMNNAGDQFDCDFCRGKVWDSIFSVADDVDLAPDVSTDGLDVSGSNIDVGKSFFNNLSDKGISVGEGSSVRVNGSSIYNSRVGIAVKDGSVLYLEKGNVFEKNIFELSQYNKKKFFKAPGLHLHPDERFTFERVEGSVYSLLD